jgi:hypothetical protein
MKKVIFMILLTWFVGLRMPEPSLPGVIINMVVGPFNSKDECNAYRTLLKQMAELFEDSVLTECKSVT